MELVIWVIVGAGAVGIAGLIILGADVAYGIRESRLGDRRLAELSQLLRIEQEKGRRESLEFWKTSKQMMADHDALMRMIFERYRPKQ